jgi:hypothetical protein
MYLLTAGILWLVPRMRKHKLSNIDNYDYQEPSPTGQDVTGSQREEWSSARTREVKASVILLTGLV